MLNKVEAPVTSMVEAYKSTVLAKDVDAHVALYGENARLFDMWGEWSLEGRDAVRAMVAAWFGSLGEDRVAVRMDDLQATAGDDVVAAHAFVTYAAISSEGRELRSMQNRLTWVLCRNAGEWRIIHQHTSAPIDFETMKVSLRRH